ncbi:MAG: response regulator transcription factor [Spirochaetota bacterium]
MAELILIADDHPETLELLRRIIEKEGFQTILANDGEKALEYALRERPDLVLLERLLPRANGLQVCTRLKEELAVPVIFLSVLDSEADIVDGLRAGADDYLTKPFSPVELTARIQRVLSRYRVSRVDPETARHLQGMKKKSLQASYLTMRYASREAAWNRAEWRAILCRIRDREEAGRYGDALSLAGRCRKILERRQALLGYLRRELIALRSTVLLAHLLEQKLIPGVSAGQEGGDEQLLALYSGAREVLGSLDLKIKRLSGIRGYLERKQRSLQYKRDESTDARTP